MNTAAAAPLPTKLPPSGVKVLRVSSHSRRLPLPCVWALHSRRPAGEASEVSYANSARLCRCSGLLGGAFEDSACYGAPASATSLGGLGNLPPAPAVVKQTTTKKPTKCKQGYVKKKIKKKEACVKKKRKKSKKKKNKAKKSSRGKGRA